MNASKKKWTPGPWCVAKGHVIHTAGDPDHLVAATAYEDDMSVTEANSNLIASAPELAESLRQALEYVEMVHAHHSAMSVDEIEESLQNVQSKTSEVMTCHHIGCSRTTRVFNLNAARTALRKAGVYE